MLNIFVAALQLILRELSAVYLNNMKEELMQCCDSFIGCGWLYNELCRFLFQICY